MFDTVYETIPPILDDLQPGPELGGVLAMIDVTAVSPYDRIVVLRNEQRMESFYQARKYLAMASVVAGMEDEFPQYRAEAAAAEIRAALHLTRRMSDSEVLFALELQQRLPRVWEALMDGEIDVRRAKMFSQRTGHLPDAAARRVVDRVIETAGTLTTGELKARLDREAIEGDPDAAQEHYEYSVKNRRVFAEPTTSGTADLLGLELPPHRVTAVTRNLNHIARSLKTKDETRTMDQLRADIYLDLLLAGVGEGTSPSGGFHISTDLDTLIGYAAHPGELNGYGPVVADIARQVAQEEEDAEWRWSVTDPATGELIHDGITRRRPTAALRRRVEARDRTCIFPGCRMPSVDCDIDHTTRWADGGPTTESNQGPLCRHDHPLKDKLGWSYKRLLNGQYQWTSRLGHTYTTSGLPP